MALHFGFVATDKGAPQVQSMRDRGDAVKVDCVEKLPHYTPGMQSNMLTPRSVFCLIMSGQISSTQHLNDAILDGCLPVFVGPPFHALPFLDIIDYSSFALFFEIENVAWLPKVLLPELLNGLLVLSSCPAGFLEVLGEVGKA